MKHTAEWRSEHCDVCIGSADVIQNKLASWRSCPQHAYYGEWVHACMVSVSSVKWEILAIALQMLTTTTDSILPCPGTPSQIDGASRFPAVALLLLYNITAIPNQWNSWMRLICCCLCYVIIVDFVFETIKRHSANSSWVAVSVYLPLQLVYAWLMARVAAYHQ